jgi:hypothetical protein
VGTISAVVDLSPLVFVDVTTRSDNFGDSVCLHSHKWDLDRPVAISETKRKSRRKQRNHDDTSSFTSHAAMSDSEHPFDHEWTREHVRRADTPRVHEAYRQMCVLEGDIPPLAKGNRFWPSDDDFRKAWRVDEEGIWLPQKLASDWPDIFWQHVVPRLDLKSTLSLGQASTQCRERVWGEVQAEHLHEKVLHYHLERSNAFEERFRIRRMLEERDRSIVSDVGLERPNAPVETLAYAWWPMAMKALHKGAVDKTADSRDPMYMAIRSNRRDAIQFLIRAGFEITCDHLVFAVKYDRLPALTALLRHGPRGVANVQDEDGNTILHHMASMDDEAELCGLLSFNHLVGLIHADWPHTSDGDAQDGKHVDPRIENDDGLEALDIAYGYENGTNIKAEIFQFGTLLNSSEWAVWYAWYLPKLPDSRNTFECINYDFTTHPDHQMVMDNSWWTIMPPLPP